MLVVSWTGEVVRRCEEAWRRVELEVVRLAWERETTFAEPHVR